jgi:uncharacterized lipoprotein YddW (UPF0748 family)
MRITKTLGTIGLLASFTLNSVPAATYQPADITPPQPAREFRGAWVATVANIDWPSRRDLSTEQQKAELLAILDRAAALKLNAIVFQVRPACDAIYASSIEPWSEYLTGTMGKPPEPYYDPLAFVVAEAHKRGLELHAWFNPYRALHPSSKSPVASTHISKTRPQLVRKYGKHLWLDPGEKAVQDYSLSVVMDVVNRYDIDGAHFDDYFYPYKESEGGKVLDFPDEESWKRFGAQGKLERDDWRRENVNVFIQRVYNSIKANKPHVKFGLSPFGIWRPGVPPQIKGLDAHTQLYADARKWLNNGWVDYFAPQLYWQIEPKEQSFPVLLDWWVEQNHKGRHLWPGMSTASAGKWKPDEIPNQIRITRKTAGSTGHIHWNMKGVMRNAPLAETLQKELYAEPALIPASPWLDKSPPGKPKLTASTPSAHKVDVKWQPTGVEKPYRWVLQTRTGQKWATEILPANTLSRTLDRRPEAIAVTAVDRAGNMSPASAVQFRQ